MKKIDCEYRTYLELRHSTFIKLLEAVKDEGFLNEVNFSCQTVQSVIANEIVRGLSDEIK